jgi:hypothetical protein
MDIDNSHIDKLLKKCTILKIKCTEHNGNDNYMIVDEYIISFSHAYDSFIMQSNNCSSIINHDAKLLEFITREFKKYAYGLNKLANNVNDIAYDAPKLCTNKSQHIHDNNANKLCSKNITLDVTPNVTTDVTLYDVIDDNIKESVIPKTNKNIQQKMDDPQNVDEIDEQMNNLKNKMEKLMNTRDEQIDNNTSIKKKVDEQEEVLNDYVLEKVTDEKQKLRRDKEKNEEMVRVFRCDKKVYRLIKEDVDNDIIKNDEIPSLFEDKYPIFEFMDSNNLIVLNDLPNDDEFKLYCEYYEEAYPPKIVDKDSNKEYVPHNVNYLPEDEKNKFLEQEQKQQPDIINDFINKKCNLQENYINKEDSSDYESESSDDSDDSSDSNDVLNLNAKIANQTNFASVDDILDQLDGDEDDIKINLTKVKKQDTNNYKNNIVPLDDHKDINMASIESILTDAIENVPFSKSALACVLDK